MTLGQANDWPIHKLVCTTFEDFSPDKRPSDRHKRAILFPQDGEQPHFFWLRFVTPEDDDYDYAVGQGDASPKLGALVGATSAATYNGVIIEIVRNLPLERPVENKFKIVGKFLEANSQETIPAQEVNKSLLKIDRELQDVWYGQIVAYGLHATDNGPLRCFDMGPMEFRHAVDALRMRYDQVQEHRENLVAGPTVTGARIGNAADLNVGRRKPVEIFPVSASQCTTKSDIAAPICDRIGIPLVLRRLPLSLTGRDRRVNFPGEVIGMSTLLHYLNPLLPLLDLRHGLGSAIAVRKDGKPLYHAHMAAFMDYGNELIKTQFLETGLFQPVSLDACSKENFMTWYAQWKERKRPEGEFDVDVPSPYDV